MKYKDLVNFEPIDSVIQLTDANDETKAMQLLDTFVISDRMADTINNTIIKQLQYVKPEDNKGIMVVGNYGSGKSHLMSVISTIAEHKGSSNHLQNSAVAENAKQIEGKFKVIRFEIGSTEMSLREIITQQLELGLQEMGITFEFPAADQIVTNKNSLLEMMTVFHNSYPEKGLLIVVDELLDYLRGRKEQELTLDLGFLREIGEIAHNTRFRFIAGIQEMLFDNPRFSFVADSLRRVKERFEQVRIVKEDISYVISERLLKKNEKQKALVREHLASFTKLYGRLSEDMEKFVDLYPIHPSYLTTFEKVHNIEKRVALKTITREIQKIIDQDVPQDSTGVVSYDSYWSFIEEDPSNKTIPSVREVLEKTAVLKDKVNSSFPSDRKGKMYKDVSLRIVNGLALNRLTMDDIYSPVGLTASTLKDDLFLVIPGQLDFLLEDDDPAAFLESSISVALKMIMETVSYQYLSVNQENGQYYLDLKKDIDIESLINDQSEIIEDATLDSYYYKILQNAVALDDNTYVSGYRIWQHEIPWEKRRIMRRGYLFFGSPNERSTAQPERDFYIYMLRPFYKAQYKDEWKEDEVFFELSLEDGFFKSELLKYAAANELYNETTSAQKRLYRDKIDNYFKKLNKWLTERFVDVFKITYKGKTGFLSDFGMFLPQEDNIKSLINFTTQYFLEEYFEKKYEDYPSFRNYKPGFISNENIKAVASDALQRINGRNNLQGEAVLEGLVLFDNQKRITSESVIKSAYARWIIDVLNDKGQGKVLNNDDLFNINAVRGVEDRRLLKKFNLEPELVVVLLGALLSTGQIEVNIEGKTYTAMDFSDFAVLSMDKLSRFSYIKKPSGLPLTEINAILELFDESAPNNNEDILEGSIRRMNSKLDAYIEESLKNKRQLSLGYIIGTIDVLDNNKRSQYADQLDSFKQFCEKLLRYDSIPKMKNLSVSLVDIQDQKRNKELIEILNQLKKNVDEVSQLVNYLDQAKYNYGQNSEWSQKVDSVVKRLRSNISDGVPYMTDITELRELKQDYIDEYYMIHEQSRLTATEENKKRDILQSPQANMLHRLQTGISLLPGKQFSQWSEKLSQTEVCYRLKKTDLEKKPICPHCSFLLSTDKRDSKKVLSDAMDNLTTIYENWLDILVTNLRQESVQESLSLLTKEEQVDIKLLVDSKELPFPLKQSFIEMIQNLFEGFEKVELSKEDIIRVLGNGSPMTVNELEGRIHELILNSTHGKDKDKVRIMYKG
ncbi:DUF6079 family protein [Enterococcus avium]|uniref:DUF6079 family protein n=1 Tax=Enterococcus avium TaxID=33945 RepID=UPI0032E526D0